MQPREFGDSGIHLSPITFGSMRLDPRRISFDGAVALISHLYDNGVTTFHSSHEYETDNFFCQVLGKFQHLHKHGKIQHVAKIGVPHFDETEFAGNRLVELVDRRLRDLNAERLDIVQWLVRHQPNDDSHRLPILRQCQEELNNTWEKLQRAGKVGVLTSFPYSIPFAKAVLQTNSCKGLVTYLNPLELEMSHLLDDMSDRGQGYIAIRPFCGGLFTNATLTSGEQDDKQQKIRKFLQKLEIPLADVNKFAVQFPLLHSAVTSTMLSVSSISHADIAIASAREAIINRDRFWQIVRTITD